MNRKDRRSNRKAVSAEPAFTVGLKVVKIKHTFFYVSWLCCINNRYLLTIEEYTKHLNFI